MTKTKRLLYGLSLLPNKTIQIQLCYTAGLAVSVLFFGEVCVLYIPEFELFKYDDSLGHTTRINLCIYTSACVQCVNVLLGMSRIYALIWIF